MIDATLIAAPSSTRNSSGERDPKMHQTKKGNQWHIGMKAHIGVDARSGLVHAVVGTAANVNDVTQAHALVHGEEMDVFGDTGYQRVDKRAETQGIDVNWHVAMRPGKRKALDKSTSLSATLDELEQVKARIWVKVEHPFRVIERQFGPCEGALSGSGQEHRSAAHAVCAVHLVDGAAHVAARDAGRVRLQAARRPRNRAKSAFKPTSRGRNHHHPKSNASTPAARGLCRPSLALPTEERLQ